MSTATRLHYSYAEYLRSLEMSPLKLEYCDGVIYAMAAAPPAHAQLAAAVIGALHRLLPRSCRVATSDMKIRLEATDLSTFPDASVICGELAVSAIDGNAVTSPTVLIEVTSTPPRTTIAATSSATTSSSPPCAPCCSSHIEPA